MITIKFYLDGIECYTDYDCESSLHAITMFSQWCSDLTGTVTGIEILPGYRDR